MTFKFLDFTVRNLLEATFHDIGCMATTPGEFTLLC